MKIEEIAQSATRSRRLIKFTVHSDFNHID